MQPVAAAYQWSGMVVHLYPEKKAGQSVEVARSGTVVAWVQFSGAAMTEAEKTQPEQEGRPRANPEGTLEQEEERQQLPQEHFHA